MTVLGLIVIGLAIALFFTCLKLRKQQQARVGSALPSSRSPKALNMGSSSDPEAVVSNQVHFERTTVFELLVRIIF